MNTPSSNNPKKRKAESPLEQPPPQQLLVDDNDDTATTETVAVRGSPLEGSEPIDSATIAAAVETLELHQSSSSSDTTYGIGATMDVYTSTVDVNTGRLDIVEPAVAATLELHQSSPSSSDSTYKIGVTTDLHATTTTTAADVNRLEIVEPAAASATLELHQSSPSSSDSTCRVGVADVNRPENLQQPIDVNAGTTGITSSSTNAPAAVIGSLTGRPPIQLYLTWDDDSMSQYHCFIRRHMELFEADYDDVATNVRGRNTPIILGQVGIRCRFCNGIPPNERTRGAVYYPSKLDGIYQVANTLATVHLGEHCPNVDDSFRNHITNLRNNSNAITASRMGSGGGGARGKKMWGERAAVLGVYEDANGLRFEPSINYRQRNYLDI